MRYSVRLFIAFLFFFAFALLLRAPVNAQINTPQQPNVAQQFATPYTNANVPKNLHTLSQNILIEVMSSVACQLTGIDPIAKNQRCLGVDKTTNKIGFVENGGVLGFLTNGIAMLYTPPIHTSDYFKTLAENFGISKKTYAQATEKEVGVGLTTIAPISGLWQTFRNIVYALFVIVFVFIGIGIMFRTRIDPRTVMTIQNQIPKIVIALILVTFSFAIAGFLIDIMWVAILLVANILMPTSGSGFDYITPFGLLNVIPGTSIANTSATGVGGMLSIMSNVAGFMGASIFKTGFNATGVQSLIALPTNSCDPGILGLGGIACFLGGVLSSVLGAILGFFIGMAVSLIAFFVVAIALIYACFKLWFELLKAYISILIDIVFAPFWIVAGLFPGTNSPGNPPKVGFGAWARDMLGNLMAFPAAIAMFFLAAIFTRQFIGSCPDAASCKFFIPPLIGPQGSNFGPVIAFGLIMMTPNVVKMTKSIFKSAGVGIGPAGLGFGLAAAGMVGGSVKSRLYWRDRDNKPHGPLAAAQRNATDRMASSGVGRRVGGSRPVQFVRNSRPVGWFKERGGRGGGTTPPTTPPATPPPPPPGRTGPAGGAGPTGPAGRAGTTTPSGIIIPPARKTRP